MASGLRAVERGADGLAVRAAIPWDAYTVAIMAGVQGAAFTAAGVGGPRVVLALGVLLCGAALAAFYKGVTRTIEGVILDRRTGDCRTVMVRRGRRVVTRRPMHMLRRVEVRPNGLEGTYALVFEVRGEPSFAFPPTADAVDAAEGEAIAQRVRAFLAGDGANRKI